MKKIDETGRNKDNDVESISFKAAEPFLCLSSHPGHPACEMRSAGQIQALEVVLPKHDASASHVLRIVSGQTNGLDAEE